MHRGRRYCRHASQDSQQKPCYDRDVDGVPQLTVEKGVAVGAGQVGDEMDLRYRHREAAHDAGPASARLTAKAEPIAGSATTTDQKPLR
jgi:hypothetical protein